jgi:hypothetical protein
MLGKVAGIWRTDATLLEKITDDFAAKRLLGLFIL